MKNKYFFRNMSFRNKMILIFTIICMFSAGIAGIVYYQYARREIESNFQENSINIVNRIQSTIDSRFETIEYRTAAALGNQSFTTPMENFLNVPDEANEVIAMSAAANVLKDIRLGEPLVSSALIHTENEDFDDFTKIKNSSFSFAASSYAEYYKSGSDLAVQWLPSMPDEIFSGQDEVLPYIRRFTLEGYKKEDIYLILQLNQQELLEIIDGGNSGDQVLITDSDGNYIISTMKLPQNDMNKILTSTSDTVSYQGEEHFVSKGILTSNNWRLYLLKPQKELFSNINHLRFIICGLTILLTGICMIIVIMISTQMTRSLKRLAVQMNQMKEGNLDARFYYPYKDEVGSLSKTFNFMADEVQNLVGQQNKYIQTLKEERDYTAEIQRQKRQAELRALQAQINPHFLYNTLNMITWQAASQGADEISELSNSLGKFFRLSLSKGAEIITLRNEIEHIKSYLSIQEIRYAGQLCYQIQVPEEVLECKIVKLVLQPLVENAIYHGIKLKESMGHIEILVHPENSLLKIEVCDDGPGISPEALMHMNAVLAKGGASQGDGYGIYNVNERIKMYFGAEYGLHYESREGFWTRAWLTIPQEGGNADV